MKKKKFAKQICALLFVSAMMMQQGTAHASGTPSVSGSWKQVQNLWYYENSAGQTQKGWVSHHGNWYYLSPESGVMLTGWQKIQEKWYFLDPSAGAGNGRMLTGWNWIDGHCYYLK